jgi:hypothetical protein
MGHVIRVLERTKAGVVPFCNHSTLTSLAQILQLQMISPVIAALMEV